MRIPDLLVPSTKPPTVDGPAARRRRRVVTGVAIIVGPALLAATLRVPRGSPSFTVLGVADDLLRIKGKLVFPSTVPLGFILPPRVAKAAPFVSPVPNPDFSAPCNHLSSANRTLA